MCVSMCMYVCMYAGNAFPRGKTFVRTDTQVLRLPPHTSWSPPAFCLYGTRPLIIHIKYCSSTSLVAGRLDVGCWLLLVGYWMWQTATATATATAALLPLRLFPLVFLR